MTKCCSACFNRISRRLAPHVTSGTETPDEGSEFIARQWNEDELKRLRRALREHGTNWPKVSEQIPDKSNHQCKNYYLTYRKKLGLDQLVAEYYQSLGEERRPCLTDEEESGSSTSSCDDTAVHDSSDTASAASPVDPISSSATPPILITTSSTEVLNSSNSKIGTTFPLDKNSADVRITLVPPAVPTISTQQTNSSASQLTNASVREDYDSSATVNIVSFYYFLINRCLLHHIPFQL